MAINITDPSYVSEHMLDKVMREKFHDNADDVAVGNQAIKFLQVFRDSTIRNAGRNPGIGGWYDSPGRKQREQRVLVRSQLNSMIPNFVSGGGARA